MDCHRQSEDLGMNSWMQSFFKHITLITLGISTLLIFAFTANAAEKVNTTIFGVAIKGYDTVAYHTEGRPVKGSSKISHKWNDAKWYFASTAHRDLFIKDPERYAPQYGGY